MYKVQVAETPTEQSKGLMGVEELPKDEGMLFVYDDEEDRQFYMKNTLIPLDIIGINEDMEITSIVEGKPNDETLLTIPDAKYVLELNKDSHTRVGWEVEFIDDFDSVEKGKMMVLDQDGNVQMVLEGGERIVSRKETRILIRKALEAKKAKRKGKSAYKRKCKELGKFMFKVLDKQSSNTPQYVELEKEEK